jgi:hypothetical protein
VTWSEREVVGRDGNRVAVVTDVRLVAEGPPRGLTGGATLRVRGLVLSAHHTGSILGYDRHPGLGPKLVAALVRRLHRNARYPDWQQVTSAAEHRVELDVDLAELPRLL